MPLRDDGHDLVVELEQSVAVFLDGGGLRRHVDAAGFHHDRIDQRIHPFDVERRLIGDLDRFRQFRCAAGIVIGQRGDCRGQKRKQRENRIEPRRQRKSGCKGSDGKVILGFHMMSSGRYEEAGENRPPSKNYAKF